MQVAQQKIEQELRNAYAAEQSALNQEVKLALARASSAAKEKAAKEKAGAQNRASMWSAIGGVAGTAIGAAFGGPAGAALGSSIGSGIGGAASTIGE
jgi:glucose-6-phosphate isomerase